MIGRETVANEQSSPNSRWRNLISSFDKSRCRAAQSSWGRGEERQIRLEPSLGQLHRELVLLGHSHAHMHTERFLDLEFPKTTSQGNSGISSALENRTRENVLPTALENIIKIRGGSPYNSTISSIPGTVI